MAEQAAPWPEQKGRLPHQLAVADIGGTNSRFALAVRGPAGIELCCGWRTPTAAHPSLAAAFAAWRGALGARGIEAEPRAGCFAVAAPATGELVRLTNARWTIDPARLAGELGLDETLLVNDFEAIAHSLVELSGGRLRSLDAGAAWPRAGMVALVGPGTGLGVAGLLLRPGAPPKVLASEGGHISFAPWRPEADGLLAFARERLGRQGIARVSVERVVSGPGLLLVHDWLAAEDGAAPWEGEAAALWAEARQGPAQRRAARALGWWLEALGAVAGDHALTLGAGALVLAGGLVPRLGNRLATSGFRAALADKGRFADRLARLPVFLIDHPEPGLLGAAAAWWAQQGV